MLEYTDNLNGAEDLFIGSTDVRNYGAQIFRAEQLGMARYASILAVGDIESDFGTAGFIGNPVPVVRLHIAEAVNVNELLSNDNIIEVFPSPASDYVNIHIDLVEEQSELNLQIMDASGKIVQQQQHQYIQTNDLNVPVQNLPVGSYFVNVQTPDGSRSVPFVIQR